jgi:hypothetical protein
MYVIRKNAATPLTRTRSNKAGSRSIASYYKPPALLARAGRQ